MHPLFFRPLPNQIEKRLGLGSMDVSSFFSFIKYFRLVSIITMELFAATDIVDIFFDFHFLLPPQRSKTPVLSPPGSKNGLDRLRLKSESSPALRSKNAQRLDTREGRSSDARVLRGARVHCAFKGGFENGASGHGTTEASMVEGLEPGE